MSAWFPPPLPTDRPAYLGIADAIGDAIAAGALGGGERLPTVRELATHLGVATATALRGYAEAEQRGLTTATVGRGSFVRPAEEIQAAWRAPFATRGFVAPDVYDLRSRVVPGPSEWATPEGFRELLPARRHQAALLSVAYTLTDGTDPWTLREAGVQWAERCGVPLTPDHVLIAAGGQHAVAAALSAVSPTRAPVVVPALTNSGALIAAHRLGIPLVPVRADAHGLDTRHLERTCRSAHPCAIYCAPASGNPMPSAMSADRRSALVRIATQHKLWIIEDDEAGVIVQRDSPALATVLPRQTLWLGSVSQSLGFGFRLAFVGAPPALAAPMQEALRAFAWTAATPGALLAARWLADGTIERVIRLRRAAIARRLAVVRRALGRRRYVMMRGVPYVWLEVPPGWRADTLHAALLAAGVSVAPCAQFTAGAVRPPQGVRLSAGALLSIGQYADALRRVADVCAHPSRARRARLL
jgi:DNA-binding transcriptional MocR family regulator